MSLVDAETPPQAPVPAPPAAPAAPAAADPAAPAPEPPPAPEYLAPGIHQHEINIEGQVRRWTTVVPPGSETGVPAAVVVVLHGVGGRGVDMRSFGFEPLAATPRVVMVYPDAMGGAWNDGRPGADPMMPGVNIDDVRFLRLMIEATSARTGADPTRVGVVGFSNGAIMAGRVACEMADNVSAVVLVAGSGWQGFDKSCRPSRAVAMMTVAGSADPIVPYAGGKVADFGTRKRGFVAPVEDFFKFWLNYDGCAATDPGSASAKVTESKGLECRGGATVLRYRINGGGHEWFRAPVFDTTNAVWSFLSARFVLPR
ncbi:MAG: alpha/beta hydrolase family esterase [Acidimicrobiales bacterium]